MAEYQSVNASTSPETQMNENMETLEAFTVYGKRQPVTSGLTWGYYGGRWGGFSITAGTLTLTGEGSPTPTNYIVVARTTGVISVSIVSTNWDNVADYARVYKITTTASAVISVEDHRAGPYGVHGKPGPISWRQATDNDTLVLADAENGVAMNAATSKAFTVPPNISVAFPIGTSILVYQEGVGQTSVSPGVGVTIRCVTQVGSPLPALALSAQFALATLVKRGTNEWILSGALVTS